MIMRMEIKQSEFTFLAIQNFFGEVSIQKKRTMLRVTHVGEGVCNETRHFCVEFSTKLQQKANEVGMG